MKFNNFRERQRVWHFLLIPISHGEFSIVYRSWTFYGKSLSILKERRNNYRTTDKRMWRNPGVISPGLPVEIKARLIEAVRDCLAQSSVEIIAGQKQKVSGAKQGYSFHLARSPQCIHPISIPNRCRIVRYKHVVKFTCVRPSLFSTNDRGPLCTDGAGNWGLPIQPRCGGYTEMTTASPH